MTGYCDDCGNTMCICGDGEILDVNALVIERDALVEQLAAVTSEWDRLAAALDMCMVGGNSIASALIGALGGDFPTQFENGDQALEALWGKRADTDDMLYEVWTCWKAVMEARHMAGGPDWKEALAAAPAAAGPGGERLCSHCTNVALPDDDLCQPCSDAVQATAARFNAEDLAGEA